MSKVKLISCSGIGKAFGLIARETALKVANEMCPDISETTCLAIITKGDEESKEQLEGNSCITIDGCPKMCAAKSVKNFGGDIALEYRVVDAFKRHRGAKPGDGTKLTEEGWQIVDEIAEEIAQKVEEISKEA